MNSHISIFPKKMEVRDFASFEPHEDYSHKMDNFMFIHLRDCAVRMVMPRPRTMAWAIMLKTLPEPPRNFLKSLKERREEYDRLQKKFTSDPHAVIGDDPLSQKDESVWNQHFCDNDLKALILQDVVRTFPDEPYFRDSDVQDLMVRVLFVYSRAYGYMGYRQGMHEILAYVLLELHHDRKFAPADVSDILKEYLREDCLETDCYMIFKAVMTNIQKYYSVAITNGMLTSTMRNGSIEVVRFLSEVNDDHLKRTDPELAAHLLRCSISLELFGIRWLRLLFGREFPRSDVSHLWSFIFSDGPYFPNLHHVVVAMLVSMKSSLMNPEPGVVLSALMRPPPVSVGHVIELALHYTSPYAYPRPTTPTNNNTNEDVSDLSFEESNNGGSGDLSAEGVAEGADVARELATLALLRAQLPIAAAALAAAIPRPSPNVARPLHQIVQLSSLLQCRNHALADVETALEAAEGSSTETVGSRQLIPVSIISGRRSQPSSSTASSSTASSSSAPNKMVPMKLFHQCESHSVGDLPSLDPLHLRSE